MCPLPASFSATDFSSGPDKRSMVLGWAERFKLLGQVQFPDEDNKLPLPGLQINHMMSGERAIMGGLCAHTHFPQHLPLVCGPQSVGQR